MDWLALQELHPISIALLLYCIYIALILSFNIPISVYCIVFRYCNSIYSNEYITVQCGCIWFPWHYFSKMNAFLSTSDQHKKSTKTKYKIQQNKKYNNNKYKIQKWMPCFPLQINTQTPAPKRLFTATDSIMFTASIMHSIMHIIMHSIMQVSCTVLCTVLCTL